MITMGSEYFLVTEGNRFALARKTRDEINRVTSLLSSRGMIVTSVHVSDPQPIKLGFTYWQNNVTLTWQADLDNTIYRNYLLSCYEQEYNKANSRDEYYMIFSQA